MIAKLVFILSVCSATNVKYNCKDLYKNCMEHLKSEIHFTYEEKQEICTNIIGDQILKILSGHLRL